MLGLSDRYILVVRIQNFKFSGLYLIAIFVTNSTKKNISFNVNNN